MPDHCTGRPDSLRAANNEHFNTMLDAIDEALSAVMVSMHVLRKAGDGPCGVSRRARPVLPHQRFPALHHRMSSLDKKRLVERVREQTSEKKEAAPSAVNTVSGKAEQTLTGPVSASYDTKETVDPQV